MFKAIAWLFRVLFSLNDVNYGFRMAKALVVGNVLWTVWLVVAVSFGFPYVARQADAVAIFRQIVLFNGLAITFVTQQVGGWLLSRSHIYLDEGATALRRLWPLVLSIAAAFHTYALARSLAIADTFASLVSWIMMGYLPACLLAGAPAFVYLSAWLAQHPQLRQWTLFGKGSSAIWSSPWTFDKHLVDFSGPAADPKWIDKIYLGKSLFDDDFAPRHIGVGGSIHMVTVGMSGSGKSITAVWPTLALYGGSALVIDPAGEHATVTYRRRRRLGKCYVLDPFSIVRGCSSSRYNPLAEIDINHSAEALELIRAVADSCVIAEGNGTSQHFVDTARLILTGILAHVVTVFPKTQHHLGTVYDLLTYSDHDTGRVSPEVFTDLLNQMASNPALGKAPQQAAKLMIDAGPDEQGSFMTTIARAVSWLQEECVREHLSTSELSLRELASADGAKATVYVVLPGGKEESHSRWLRILTAFAAILVRSQKRRHSKRPYPPVLFVLDEYWTYGKGLDVITVGFPTFRKDGIRLWIQIQTISQLKSIMGNESSIIVSNSTVQVFGVGNDEADTADWVTRHLGEGTNGLPLLTRQQVPEMLGQHSPRQIVFTPNARPLRLKRLAYKSLSVEGHRYEGIPVDQAIYDAPVL